MPRNDHGISSRIIFLIVFLVLAGLVAVLVIFRHHVVVTRPAAIVAARPAPNAEQKAYFASLAFADLRMSAANNFLGQTVTYLDGTITNNGAKPVRRLDVDLNFVDTLNQVVLRETAQPLADHPTPLQPGETYAFRVTFDHMPADWNQAPPRVKPAYVEF